MDGILSARATGKHNFIQSVIQYLEGNTVTKFVPEQLRKAAEIYEERNKVYGDNYKTFGAVWLALFPDGISTTSAEDPVSACNRLGVLIQIVSKLTRYCAQFNSGGHADSLDDLAVYAMMLQELDSEAKITPVATLDEHGIRQL